MNPPPQDINQDTTPPDEAPAAAAGGLIGGRLLYAIGDIHGRADLLRILLGKIRQDAAEAAPAKPPILVFMGDYVDRGPDSRGVVEQILGLQAEGYFEVACLRGNHDQYLLEFIDNPGDGAAWLDYGGAATLASYGVLPPMTRSDAGGWRAAGKALSAALPPGHRHFFEQTILSATYGDFVFVHAGVRPGVELEDQDPKDLMSIRRSFLKSTKPIAGKVVVFGHTPFPKPSLKEGKMALDTGAYATGILTAARIGDGAIRFLQTV